MKKVLVVLAIVCASSMVSAQSNYKIHAAVLDYNSVDTSTITVKERIKYCIAEQAGKYLSGEKAKADFTNSNLFSDAQLIEFCIRCQKGGMYEELKSYFAESTQLTTNKLNMSDAQMNTIFYTKSWAVIKLIFSSSL